MPTFTVTDVDFVFTDITGTDTVILHIPTAVFPQYAATAVLPADTAVILPFSSTVTMLSSFEYQVTSPSVVFDGVTVAVSFAVSPISSVRLSLSSIIFSAGIYFFFTITVNVLNFVPSLLLTVTMAIPSFFAVTTPLSFISATTVSVAELISHLR